MAGQNPDFAIQDLYDNIEKENFPSWDLKLQIMTVEQSKTAKVNPLDVTKVNLIISSFQKKISKSTFGPFNFRL